MTISKNERKRRIPAKKPRHFPRPATAKGNYGVNIIPCAGVPFKHCRKYDDERKILCQALWKNYNYGNIRPDSRIYNQDSPFVQAAKLKQTNLDKLMAVLNDSEKELFEKYCDAQGDIEGIARYDIFSYALKFGILLMAEVFTGMGEVTGEGSV